MAICVSLNYNYLYIIYYILFDYVCINNLYAYLLAVGVVKIAMPLFLSLCSTFVRILLHVLFYSRRET